MSERNDGDKSMSKGGKPTGDVFDLERIRQIVELMEQHELSEIDLQQGDDKIRLARGSAAPVYMPAPMPQAAPASAPAAAPGAAGGDRAGTITINAPMVGTFYSRANPESDPFVKVGSMVTEDTVVCIVEAMKVFNEIVAPTSGLVCKVVVKNGDLVQPGDPILYIG